MKALIPFPSKSAVSVETNALKESTFWCLHPIFPLFCHSYWSFSDVAGPGWLACWSRTVSCLHGTRRGSRWRLRSKSKQNPKKVGAITPEISPSGTKIISSPKLKRNIIWTTPQFWVTAVNLSRVSVHLQKWVREYPVLYRLTTGVSRRGLLSLMDP